MKNLKFQIVGLCSALVLASVGSSTVAQALTSDPSIDQSASELSLDQSRAANAEDWPMQRFTPSESGSLTRIDLALGRSLDREAAFHVDVFPMDRDGLVRTDPVYGNPNQDPPLQIEATAVSEIEPNEPNYTWTTIELRTPIGLLAGQRYLIRLVPEEGSGTLTWFTSSSLNMASASVDENGNIIWADNEQTIAQQYGFKTWMKTGEFTESGTWTESAIATDRAMDCGGENEYCVTFDYLSTDFSGSKVFGISRYANLWLHSTDSGTTYSTSPSAFISNSTSSASYINGQGVIRTRRCNLWNSVDGGNTFTRVTAFEINGDRSCFQQVVATEDGQVLAAVGSGDRVNGVYVSTDGGTTWHEHEFERSWRSIAVSSDGSIMIMVSDNGSIYMSSNYGTDWMNFYVDDIYTPGTWNSVALSANGQDAFLSDNHRLFKVNINTGQESNLGIEALWRKIQISSDGQTIAALDESGHIFISRDGGATMNLAGSQGIQFVDFALAPSGSVIHASSEGKMYRMDLVNSDNDPGNIESSSNPLPSQKASEISTKKAAVQFDSSSTRLSADAKDGIRAAVKKAGKKANYVVTGSAGMKDGVPTRSVKALAKKRAMAVKNYLTRLGVNASHIDIRIKITKQGLTPKTKLLANFTMS